MSSVSQAPGRVPPAVRWWVIGLASALGGAAAASSAPELQLHLSVDRPGVYAVPVERLSAVADGIPLSPRHLGLSHLGTPVPLHADAGGDGELGTGDVVYFVVSRDRLWPRRLHHATPHAKLRLELGGAGAALHSVKTSEASEQDAVEAAPFRRLVFEQDRVRVPLSSPALAEQAGSAWFWAPISHQTSSGFPVDLGDLGDRVPEDAGLEIRVRLLGWSEAKLPAGTPQHVVEVLLNDHSVGQARWDGRRPHELRLTGLSADLLESGGQRLELRVPPRTVPGTGAPLIDLVYLDWVELRYRVGRLERGAGPWWLGPSPGPTWLPDPDAASGERLYAEGWWAEPEPGRGWRLPPLEVPTELWIAGGEDLRSPTAIEKVTEPPRIPEDVDYLMIVPPPLIAGAEKLAAAHRRRGLRVALVSSRAIFDHDGHGHATAPAIRAFLDRARRRAPGLRFVLLVGDADWFLPPRGGGEVVTRRGLLPTYTHFTPFGPAASDHDYARDEQSPATHLFALGRLPVASAAELERVVEKILAHLEAPARRGPPSVLLVSDHTGPSLARMARTQQQLEQAGVRLERPSHAPGVDLEVGLLAALDQGPAVVHFGGHGSRHSWQLGDSHILKEGMFFDREDVEKLAFQPHAPVVVSVSCSTAPFDHPSADSLGEAMLLAEGRGALAFIGASSRLYTVPRFGEIIVRRLLAGETVGEALVAAKRELAHPGLSSLYNLLGDPALTLGAGTAPP